MPVRGQICLTRRYCEAQGWTVVEEFVEPGASATDSKRPVFQRMFEETASPTRRFDVICVHAFSRFYRNGAEMELTIRRLRKQGVAVVSVTQPTGDDPSQELMRQIIGVFDESTSRENGKNVTRAMRGSATQGFWNGARAPLGYRIVEAERRGSKIKKRLDIDPVEAETVRLIYRLYTQGDGSSGPLGVKDVCKWLNASGYRTGLGAAFGVGPVHKIHTHAASTNTPTTAAPVASRRASRSARAATFPWANSISWGPKMSVIACSLPSGSAISSKRWSRSGPDRTQRSPSAALRSNASWPGTGRSSPASTAPFKRASSIWTGT